LGDSRALVQGEFWAKLIEDAKQRDRYTSGNIMALLSQPGPQVPIASLAAAASRPTQRPAGMQEDNDVDMMDAPDMFKQGVSSPAQQEDVAKSPPLPYRGAGIGGLNEKGEVAAMLPRGAGGPPMIQSSSGSGGKKRPRDNNDDGRSGSKKVSVKRYHCQTV
jgi:senataxin